jgi:hypothetical protein
MAEHDWALERAREIALNTGYSLQRGYASYIVRAIAAELRKERERAEDTGGKRMAITTGPKTPEPKTPGQIGYEAYASHTQWKSLATGQDLPKWEGLSEAIKWAWEVAGEKISEAKDAEIARLREEIEGLGYDLNRAMDDRG